MNIYKLERISDWEYDEYCGFVVYAKTERDALAVVDEYVGSSFDLYDWVDHSDIVIIAIGIAIGDVDSGVILDSVTAG